MKKLLLAALVALAPAAAYAENPGTNFANVAVGSSLLLPPAYVTGVNVVAGASAGFVLVIDSTTVPADGAVTPARCLPVAANAGIDINFRSVPLRTVNGTAIVFSTTGCFSKTASATAFIAADIR